MSQLTPFFKRLKKADRVSVVLDADKAGHIRVTSLNMDDASVLIGQRFIGHWEHGQVHISIESIDTSLVDKVRSFLPAEVGWRADVVAEGVMVTYGDLGFTLRPEEAEAALREAVIRRAKDLVRSVYGNGDAASEAPSPDNALALPAPDEATPAIEKTAESAA